VAPEHCADEARLDAQFFRANVEPSERYVLSVPGSSAWRVDPAATGFANLYAAGDWTACTIDAGCVEAAVISGMAAANGIHRSIGAADQLEPIIGRSGP
jgi:predicted NAD/FAD-dependent oxidoreductase